MCRLAQPEPHGVDVNPSLRSDRLRLEILEKPEEDSATKWLLEFDHRFDQTAMGLRALKELMRVGQDHLGTRRGRFPAATSLSLLIGPKAQVP